MIITTNSQAIESLLRFQQWVTYDGSRIVRHSLKVLRAVVTADILFLEPQM